MRKKLRRRELKKLLKEQGFEQVFSLEDYEKTFNEEPTKRIWFEEPWSKYIMVGTGDGNEFQFDGEFSAYSVGVFRIDVCDEFSSLVELLRDLFGWCKADSETTMESGVNDKENYSLWMQAIADAKVA